MMITSAGDPLPWGEIIKSAGFKWLHVVPSVKTALRCQKAGVDCIVASGRGVPAVAIKGDAASNIIEDGVTGSLVPADPPSELPRRGLPLIEDDALHTRFATASKARAAAVFPLEAALERQRTAIEELLG